MDPIKIQEKQKASTFLKVEMDINVLNKIKSQVQKSLDSNSKYETKDSELKTEAALLKKIYFNLSSDVINDCFPSSSYNGVRNHMRFLLLLVIKRQVQLCKQKLQVWDYVHKLEISIDLKQKKIKNYESLKNQFNQLAQDIQKQTTIQNITLSSKLENIGFADLWQRLRQRQREKIMRKDSNGQKMNKMEAKNATLELQINQLKKELNKLNQLKQEKVSNDQKELTEQQIIQTLFWKHKQAQMVQLKQQITKNQNELNSLKQNNSNLTNTIVILQKQIQQAKQKAKQKANIKQPILNSKSDENQQKQNDKTNQIMGQKLKHLKAKVLQLSASLQTDENTIKSLFKEFSEFLKQETKNTLDQISVFSSNQIQQKPKSQIASNSIPFNIYSRQLFFWDNLFLGFASNSEEKPTQNFLAERDYLVNAFEEFTQKRILRTKLLFEQNRLSNSNVHTHIDGKSNYVIVMKLLNGYFIAAYSQDPLTEGQINNGPGFIASLTNKQRIEFKQQIKNSRTASYDPYHIVFGNDELRFSIVNKEKQVSTLCGNQYSFYRPKVSRTVFFNEDEESVQYERYEVHKIILQGEEKEI